MSKILICSAHPDDYELGCYGTIKKLEAEGNDTAFLVLGEGRGHDLDNQFDKMPLLHWVHEVELKIAEHEPDIIFTHCKTDLNIDHRMTYQAVLTATRPMRDCCVKEIYSFEVPSSTEWSFEGFRPNVFFEISEEYLQCKLKTLQEKYSLEMRKYPHPRSDRGIRVLAQCRGMQVGVRYAEAFELVRMIK